jgi:hypothetical protein
MIHQELTARQRRKGGNNAEYYDRPGHDDDAGMEGVVKEVTAAATTSSRRPWQDLSDQELWALLEHMDQKEYVDDDDHEEEEMEEMMALEHQYWDGQYEQWRQGHDCDNDDDFPADTAVPCPMCYQGRLVQQDDENEEGFTMICCSNHDRMNHMIIMMADDDNDDRGGSCPFQLVLSRHNDLTLADLADRLRVVHQDHAASGCRQQLPRIMIQPSMQDDDDQGQQPTTTLVTAHCSACGMQRRIV